MTAVFADLCPGPYDGSAVTAGCEDLCLVSYDDRAMTRLFAAHPVHRPSPCNDRLILSRNFRDRRLSSYDVRLTKMLCGNLWIVSHSVGRCALICDDRG